MRRPDNRGLATRPHGRTEHFPWHVPRSSGFHASARPRAQGGAGGPLGRPRLGRRAARHRPRAARGELGARAGRRHRRHPVRRLQPLRPRARHRVGGRGDPGALRRAGRRRPRRLLRDGARDGGRAPAGDDEVVRHELPPPRAGAGAAARPSGCAPDHWLEPLREAAALGIETRPVVLGPATLPAALQGARPPARRARRARAGLRAAAARAGRGGRARGAARRAVPGARPHAGGARRDRRARSPRWPARATPSSAWRPTSPASATRSTRCWRCPWPSSTSTSSARRSSSRRRLRAGRPDGRGSRSASSTAATCG